MGGRGRHPVLPVEGEGPCSPQRALWLGPLRLGPLWLGPLRPNHSAEGRGTTPLPAGGQRACCQEEELTSSPHLQSPSLGPQAEGGQEATAQGKSCSRGCRTQRAVGQFSVRPETQKQQLKQLRFQQTQTLRVPTEGAAWASTRVSSGSRSTIRPCLRNIVPPPPEHKKSILPTCEKRPLKPGF